MIIETIGISVLSAAYGLLIAVLMIVYLNAMERVQLWSEKYASPKKWTRRGLHLLLCILALGIFFYSFLFWITIIADLIKKQLELFILFIFLFIAPFIFLKKHMFKEFKISKLWQ